jgi:hypothetical protein
LNDLIGIIVALVVGAFLNSPIQAAVSTIKELAKIPPRKLNIWLLEARFAAALNEFQKFRRLKTNPRYVIATCAVYLCSRIDDARDSDRGTLLLDRYQSYLTRDVRATLLSLFGGGVILLLIACGNAANLQIARAAGRISEISGYTSLIEDLVSDGYVVAAVEHTYTATAVVFPDGRIVIAYRDPVASRSPAEAFQQMMKGAGLQINTGAADLIFVTSW